MDTLIQLVTFAVKMAVVVIAILIILSAIFALSQKSKDKSKIKISVKKLNDQYKDIADTVKKVVLPKKDYKQLAKAQKSKDKQESKDKKDKTSDKRIYCLRFTGDIRASQVEALREQVSALIQVAGSNDEVVLVLDSPGGMVPTYGLAASQLERIKAHGIHLTVCIDRVAASGGYMMASIADKIVAAPFSIVGSIGVIAQVPNFHRFLKRHYVDYEQVTAGQYKRTMNVLAPNTSKGRKKFQEELEAVHVQFKALIAKHRPSLDIEAVATGEHWLAAQAKELNLVDELSTSDDYLLVATKDHDVFEIGYKHKKSFVEKMFHQGSLLISQIRHSLNRRTSVLDEI